MGKAASKKAKARGQAKEPEVVQPDGVFILVSEDDKGDFSVVVQKVGNTKVTEVQTILAVALKQHRRDLGLSDEG